MAPRLEIQRYWDGSHLFHGSERAGLTVLAPAHPNDAGTDPSNKDRAVYATDDVGAAILFSLTRGVSELWRLTFGPTTAHFSSAAGEQLRRNVGSLYVLPRGGFGPREGWQCKAFAAVAAVAEISVTLEDYLACGGRLRFVDGGITVPERSHRSS